MAAIPGNYFTGGLYLRCLAGTGHSRECVTGHNDN